MNHNINRHNPQGTLNRGTPLIYNNNNKHYKTLNIGTHNVQGFNLETKQRELFDEYQELDIDIIGLTETKINEKQSKITLNNKKNYKSWWTGLNDNSYTGGV